MPTHRTTRTGEARFIICARRKRNQPVQLRGDNSAVYKVYQSSRKLSARADHGQICISPRGAFTVMMQFPR